MTERAFWFVKKFMIDKDQESAEIAGALEHLSTAMEQLQARYESSQRANRRVRIALIAVLIVFGAATYRLITPIADHLAMLPQVIAQAVPGARIARLDPETAAADRQRLMDSLSPEARARVEQFEVDQKWVSDYIATSETFDPGATIALFLSEMASSVKVMPDVLTEVNAMTAEVRSLRTQIQEMNQKMDALPILANEIDGMHAQMIALPAIATEVQGMHIYMSVIARNLDSTMGEAGRMMPWNW